MMSCSVFFDQCRLVGAFPPFTPCLAVHSVRGPNSRPKVHAGGWQCGSHPGPRRGSRPDQVRCGALAPNAAKHWLYSFRIRATCVASRKIFHVTCDRLVYLGVGLLMVAMSGRGSVTSIDAPPCAPPVPLPGSLVGEGGALGIANKRSTQVSAWKAELCEF